MDVQSLRALAVDAAMRLSHCHDVHDICVRDVYLNGAVDSPID
jgi:hypothetical protein